MSPQTSEAGSEDLTLAISPLGGLNSTDNYAAVDQSQVFASQNLLYDGGLAYSRPGLQNFGATGLTHSIIFGDTLPISGALYTVLLDSSSGIYIGGYITPASTAASFDPQQYGNVCAAAGTLLIGNNVGGLINWTPGTGTYSVIAAAPYRYVAPHQGRAIAAYQNSGGSALLNPRTFAWSSPGVLTDWSEADGSAGSLAIADAEDQITGLGTLHNIVVILRNYGIHLAYPTGTLPLPFNVQAFSRRGPGCLYPATAAWTDQQVFFVSEDDVYTFDLQNVTPIGYKIRIALLKLLRLGILYRGFVTRTVYNLKPRLYYHLFPVNSQTSPHFCYDVMADNWSSHTYAIAGGWPWNYQLASQYYGFSYPDTSSSPNAYVWNGLELCEQPISFSKYLGVLQAPDTDFYFTDAILQYIDNGASSVTLELTATLNTTLNTASDTQTIGGANTGQLLRTWFRGSDIKLSGNEFVVTLTVPANSQFAMNLLACRLANTSEYRGS